MTPISSRLFAKKVAFLHFAKLIQPFYNLLVIKSIKSFCRFFTLNRIFVFVYAQKHPNTVSRDFSKSTLRPLKMNQSVYPYFWSHYFITHLFVSNFFSIKGFEFKTVTYRFSHRQKQQPKLLDQNFSFYQWCKNAVIFLLLLRGARRVLSTSTSILHQYHVSQILVHNKQKKSLQN